MLVKKTKTWFISFLESFEKSCTGQTMVEINQRDLMEGHINSTPLLTTFAASHLMMSTF